jgi:ABC-type transport system involved in cytochrome c biogenesis permease component
MSALRRARRIVDGLFDHNPVFVREIRTRLRLGRVFKLTTISAFLLSALTLGLYAAAGFGPETSPDEAEGVGRTFFWLIFFFGGLSSFGGSHSFRQDRDNGNFDLIRLTLLPPRTIAVGYMSFSILWSGLVLLVTLPIQFVAFNLGGLTEWEIALNNATLFFSGVTLASMDMFFAALTRRRRVGGCLNGLFFLFVTLGGMMLVLNLSGPGNYGGMPPTLNILAQFALIVINPLLTFFTVNVLLIEQAALTSVLFLWGLNILINLAAAAAFSSLAGRLLGRIPNE